MTSIDLKTIINIKSLSIDETPLTFGKYKGQTPEQIAEENPSYLIWAYENLDNKPCTKLLYYACLHDEEEKGEGSYLDGYLRFK